MSIEFVKILVVVISIMMSMGLLSPMTQAGTTVPQPQPLGTLSTQSPVPGNEALPGQRPVSQALQKDRVARLEPSDAQAVRPLESHEKTPIKIASAPRSETRSSQAPAVKKPLPKKKIARKSVVAKKPATSLFPCCIHRSINTTPCAECASKPAAKKPATSLFPCCIHRSINTTPCAECASKPAPCSAHFVTDSGMCQNCFQS